MTAQSRQLVSTRIKTHKCMNITYICTPYKYNTHTHTDTLLVSFPVFWGTLLGKTVSSASREQELLVIFLRY